MFTEEIIEDILGRWVDIKTVNAAVTDINKVAVFGPDTVKFNLHGYVEEQETATVMVDATVRYEKLLQIYQAGFHISLSGQESLAVFIRNLEKLIESLLKMKSANASLEDIMAGKSGVSLRELINFYMTLIECNSELVNEKLVNDLKSNDNGLLVIGSGSTVFNNNIKSGERFLEEALNTSNNIATHSKKNKIERLRDEY